MEKKEIGDYKFRCERLNDLPGIYWRVSLLYKGEDIQTMVVTSQEFMVMLRRPIFYFNIIEERLSM